MTGAAGRGTGWVVAQFALIGVVALAAFLTPTWPGVARTALVVAGAVVALAGGVLAVAAARELGPALTPFPKPSHHGAFVDTGPFRVVRHPIYTGGLLFCLGVSLATGILTLVASGALAVLWAGKIRVEEVHLVERFPTYAAYQARVPARLVPGVY
jgi:protein-S-isoprenylcysteine O-methyltransferase Ste14